MSYIYQSRQLHPRVCSLGMGIVGAVITEAKKTCPGPFDYSWSTHEMRLLAEGSTPKKLEGGKAVFSNNCFETGGVFEARRAGNPRLVQWCCPKGEFYLPKRGLTRSVMEQYGGHCGLTRGASGEYEPEPGQKIPTWRDQNSYISSALEPLGVKDNGYELYCSPWRVFDTITDPVTGKRVLAAKIKTELAPVDAAVLQQHAEATQQEIARRESIIQESAVPEGNIIERYGFPLLLIAGTIGIGVTAALFKRFSVASKQAKDAKAIAVSGGSL